MDTFEQFLQNYPIHTYEKGQVILLKDEVPKGVYLIESGFVKVYSIGPNGEEQILTIDSKGEDFPIGFTAGLIKKAQYFYEAYSRCVIRLVPAGAYMNHLTENNASLMKRHVRIIKLLLSTLTKVEALEQPKAIDKVARTLLTMAERMGVKNNSRKALKLHVTQQEIANSIGLTRETAGQELKKLELKKLLQYSRQSYTLHVERIKKYLERRGE